MKRVLFYLNVFSLIFQVLIASAADSVDVTFRYVISGKGQVYVTGEFVAWDNTALPMAYVGGDLWVRTVRLAVGGNPSPPTVGIPGAWQYKFYYPGASPWPNDPLNHHVNPRDNDNSYLYLKDPTIYHLLPNQRQGFINTNNPNISAYIFPKVGTVVDTSAITLKINEQTYSQLGKYYNFEQKQFIFNPPESLPDGSYDLILDVGTNADTVNFVIQTESPPAVPLPAYAEHGVTLPSLASNDSTTFRVQVGSTNLVVLRIAPDGQPVASAIPQVMRKDPDSDNWWLNLDLAPGTYEYLYQNDSGTNFYDPWGRWNGEFGSRFTIGPAGLTADDYQWQSDNYQRPPINQLVIYELHVGEFAGGYYNLSAGEAGFLDLVTLLPHLDSLGINTIELMPVNDYGNVGLSGHSWGYDLNSYFALEPAYGTPREFKVLVDSAHARGMAIILDVVFNHMNGTGPLWRMQPDVNTNPYFKSSTDLRPNEDALFFFEDTDHWTDEMQELVYQVLKMWIDEYHVDGFRYDFTQGIGWNVNDPQYGILGWSKRIDQDYNGGIYQIAEHLPESPALIYYSGLTGGWHDSYRDEIFDEARFQNTSLSNFENLILDLGAYSGNDVPSSPASYADRTEPVNANVNHDEQSLIYEMTTFQGVSLDDAITRDKLYATFMFTSLGIPMLWQGMEFSAPRGWPSGEEKLSYRPVEWNLLPTARGQAHFAYYKKLIFYRKYHPALYRGTLQKLYKYNSKKVLVWGFQDVVSPKKLMAVANLSGNEQTVTDVPWLGEGDWHNIFDQSILTVSGNVVNNMTLPAYTAWVFSNFPDSLLLPIHPVYRILPKVFALSQNYPNPFNPETTIDFEIPRSVNVNIAVFNTLGQKVKTIADEVYPTGRYRVKWNGTNSFGQELASGIYILHFRAGDFVENRRLVFMK